MKSTLPLLIFDTNILIDLWTQRDEGTATTLVSLANTKAEILVPEFVREEFDVIYSSSIPTFARIVPHTQAAHLKGELRYLSGRAPDGPLKGLKDCRIYEAVLEIAHGDHLNKRDRYFVTKDKDFRKESLIDELALLGVTLEHEVGKLYAALR